MNIEKAKATKAAKKAQFAAQTVRIDDKWSIIRSDELNWEIQKEGTFQGYFPTLVSALKALPAKMLDSVAKNDLADVLRSVEGIRETIEKALP